MITRNPPSHIRPSLLHPKFIVPSTNKRHLHARLTNTQPPIPPPSPFVPDPATFLSLIGRNLSAHASKIPNWHSLFTLTSTQLQELGIEPARTRRYLLWWRDRYRKGVYGVGGDLKYVKDGEAEVRIVEVPVSVSTATSRGEGTGAVSAEKRRHVRKMEEMLPTLRRMVVNEPAEAVEKIVSAEGVKAVEGMKIRGARQIVGPFLRPVKGTDGGVARIKVQEGMWEVKRGEKIDGGERRKVMVRRKRLLEERRTGRK